MIQGFLAPELRQHRAELVSVRGEVASVRSELTAKIETVESKIDAVESRWERFDSQIEVFKPEVGSGCSALGAALENAVLHGELSTAREIADCIRIERLEKERGQLPNS